MLMNGETILSVDSLTDPLATLNCETLKHVRKDMLDGRWPTQCNRCKVDSETGVQPRNEWETKRHADSFTYLDAITTTDHHGEISDSKLISFDLRIGNQCNLRCIMCFPGESTPWYKDHKELTGLDYFIVDNKKYSLIQSESDFDWANDKKNIDLLVASSQYLNKIKFGGGEPLIIKHHHYLLSELIAKGYADKIELEYSVNLTVFPPNLFELWKHFKVIRICASIDAYGDANDAIRFPSKWATIEKNLRMLDETDSNIIVFTSTTVSLLSLEYFAKLAIWIDNQKYKKINKSTYNPWASHLVYHPEWLNINLLDTSQQEQIFGSLLDEAKNYPSITKKINAYKQYCSTNGKDGVMRAKFADVFAKLQVKQNQNFQSIFPFASSLANTWK
jgi:sulfatase maturation enzyme AslB (radical SAM superfamily)